MCVTLFPSSPAFTSRFQTGQEVKVRKYLQQNQDPLKGSQKGMFSMDFGEGHWEKLQTLRCLCKLNQTSYIFSHLFVFSGVIVIITCLFNIKTKGKCTLFSQKHLKVPAGKMNLIRAAVTSVSRELMPVPETNPNSWFHSVCSVKVIISLNLWMKIWKEAEVSKLFGECKWPSAFCN